MNGFRRRFLCGLLIVAFVATLAPSDLTQAYHRHKDVELTEDDYDPGYAYCASAYVPSVRPQVILITVAVIGVIVVLYMGKQSNHTHHH